MAMRWTIATLLAAAQLHALEPIPDKTVVLTFDDAVKSHRTYVGPHLRDLEFGATFFVTALWMDDSENFMSWADIAELHAMGFEIGNHSWSHSNFGNPRHAAGLAGQLALVENALESVGVPRPSSFAWCGNTFSPDGVEVLAARGYRFARRGMQPEIPYGAIRPGPLYDRASHHPLLIPSAGDAYPDWTLEDFKRVVDRARDGKIAVVQFHGVPDVAHPWVHTPPERFAEYMAYLKEGGFHVIAMRDLERFVDPAAPVSDAMTMVHFAPRPLDAPVEALATRAQPGFWLENMLRRHKYSNEEAAQVFGWPAKVFDARAGGITPVATQEPSDGACLVLPYPGGRHPRIGFLEGAIDPQRGTKASVFAPWENGGYAVVDIPEAIFSNLGLIYLAHTHIPTIWDKAHVQIENQDWTVEAGGMLENQWALPNGIRFGARVSPTPRGANLELWLLNGTQEPLSELRTQVCVMLKGLAGFDAQTNENKTFGADTATARAADGTRSVSIAFEHCSRAWGNAQCPCIHADPTLPDCMPGERVSTAGRLEFF